MTNCQTEDVLPNSNLEISREESFFRDLPSTGQSFTEKNSIYDVLRDENNQTHFLKIISDQKGIPNWKDAKIYKSKSATSKNSETSVTIIPMSENEKNLSSLLYAERTSAEKLTVYTITNDELYDIVNNKQITKEIRETILMQFLYFDFLEFGEREYGNIPLDLFPTVKALNNKITNSSVLS